MKRIAVVAATLSLTAGWFAVTALPASAGFSASLTGVGACQPDGTFKATWTFTNDLVADSIAGSFQIDDAIIDGTAQHVTFSPTSVGEGASATGVTVTAGSVAGPLTVTVSFTPSWSDTSGTISATVDSPGDCTPATATTATHASVAPSALATTPSFTG